MTTKAEALLEVMEYARQEFGSGRGAYIPGDEIPVSGAIIDYADILAIVTVALSGWFTEGKISKEFGKELCKYVGSHHIF